jgi:hypothetical protein
VWWFEQKPGLLERFADVLNTLSSLMPVKWRLIPLAKDAEKYGTTVAVSDDLVDPGVSATRAVGLRLCIQPPE